MEEFSPTLKKLFRPRDPTELLRAYFAEAVWEEVADDPLFKKVYPFPEYGVVHCHVRECLDPYLVEIPAEPVLADIAIFGKEQTFPRLIPAGSGTKLLAELFNTKLREILVNRGVFQRRAWKVNEREKKPKAALFRGPTLPVVPWLLHRLSALTDLKLQSVPTPADLSKLLGADRSLPAAIQKQISPASCDRHITRFRKALKNIAARRSQRYAVAQEHAPEVVQRHPEMGVMYPTLSRLLGVQIFDEPTIKEIVSKLPFLMQAKALADYLGMDVVPKKTTIRSELSAKDVAALSLRLAGIDQGDHARMTVITALPELGGLKSLGNDGLESVKKFPPTIIPPPAL